MFRTCSHPTLLQTPHTSQQTASSSYSLYGLDGLEHTGHSTSSGGDGDSVAKPLFGLASLRAFACLFLKTSIGLDRQGICPLRRRRRCKRSLPSSIASHHHLPLFSGSVGWTDFGVCSPQATSCKSLLKKQLFRISIIGLHERSQKQRY